MANKKMDNKRLRKLREAAGLSQGAAAKKLGVGITAYSNYELGKRQPDTEKLLQMVELFGCSSDYLLGLSKYKNAEDLNELNSLGNDLLENINSLSSDTASALIKELNSLINVYRQDCFASDHEHDIIKDATLLLELFNQFAVVMINSINTILSSENTVDIRFNTVIEGVSDLLKRRQIVQEYIYRLENNYRETLKIYFPEI